MAIKEIFADGLIGLGMDAGIVRIDFSSLSATQKNDEGKPLMEHRQRVVMAPEAFAQTFSAMGRLMDELVRTGVLVLNESELDAGEKDDEKDNGDKFGNNQSKGPSSPNFQ